MNTTHVIPQERRLNALAVRIAREHLRTLKKRVAEYDEAVDAWYRNGEGRSPKWHTFVEGDEVYRANVGGSGYRFPECIHGMSLWTDYDNICGGCEDGLTVYQEALYAGHRDAAAYLDRMSVVQYAVDQGVPAPIIEDLTTWGLDILPSFTAHKKLDPRRLP